MVSDGLESSAIRHLVLVQATLLNKVTFAGSNPMRTVDFLPRDQPGLCTLSLRILVLHIFISLSLNLYIGSKESINASLEMSILVRKAPYSDLLEDRRLRRLSQHLDAIFPHLPLLHR